MQWITPEQEYLVQGESCGLLHKPWSEEIVGTPGGPALQPSKFYLVDEMGGVKCAFSEPIRYSIDDELGVSDIHVVLGDNLCAYHWKDYWGRESDEVSSKVLIAGLRPIHPDEVPFDKGRVIAAHEAGEASERVRREAAHGAKRQANEEEMGRFRKELQKLSSPVDATWEFVPEGWLVKRVDGLVLGHGKVRYYGIDVYREALAIMRELFGSKCSLEAKIADSESMRYYSD